MPTGVKAQGNIAGSAAAGRPDDMTEIGNIAELKIDFDNLSKVAYARSQGRHVLGGTGQVIGGYAGGPAGCAITLAAYHFFALLVLRAAVQHPYVTHFETQSVAGARRHLGALGGAAGGHQPQRRALPRVGCLRGRARDDDEPVRGGGDGRACVVIGRQRRGRARRARHAPRPRLAGGAAASPPRSGAPWSACPGAEVNAIVLRLLDAYEDKLKDPPLGQRYQDCYDVATRRPGPEIRAAYEEARAGLDEMGLQFSDPPFYG